MNSGPVYGDGRLVFVQRELLFAGGSRSLYNTSLFDPSLVSGTEDITFEAILRQYNSRNGITPSFLEVGGGL